jgi:antitoxin ParD1/3/4
MAYQIPPDIDARIQAQLASGDYATADAVLRDALDSLERRQQSLEKLQAMVREADDDIAEGRVGYFDVDATMGRVAQRLATKPSER